MEKPNVVYIVDDNASICDVLSHILSAHNTQSFGSGRALLTALNDAIPDAILLDVTMPEMSGLEACQKIKENALLSHVPIIFLSSQDTLEDRLKGYGAGGDDYICKPFEPEEITVKVDAAIRRKRLVDEVKLQAEEASVSALDIMNTLSEHSIVLHFMQSILNCVSYKQLSKDIIDSVASLNLSIAMEFSVEDEREYYSTDGETSALEKSVFDYVRDKKHIVDVGQRCAFNYPTMSILVRNMPVDNAELHGRLRDHISVIGRAAESKLLSLRKDMAMYEQRNSLVEILTQLQYTNYELEDEFNKQQEKSRNVFSDLNIKMENAFMTLGLTEEQEDQLRAIIDAGSATINEIFDAGMSLEQRFANITKDIQNVLSQSSVEEPQQEETNDSKTSDIEFF